jgi:pimeloyl-ACP methyl ester carboxylesterase
MRIPRGTASLSADVFGSTGVPALLLHGLGGTRAAWRDIPRALARSRRVIVPDLRGCGESTLGREDYSFETLALDAIAFLDALAIDRCHVVGHSLGGVIAQQLLVSYNARFASAVLVSTSSRVGEKAAATWLRLADTVAAKGLSSAQAGAARGFSAAFAEAYPEIVREAGCSIAASDPAAYSAQARAAARYDYNDALAAVAQPVLVVQGLADRMTSPGGSVLLARALSHSRLEMVEGVGHNLHVELGERFTELVEAFFTGVDRISAQA